MNGILINLTNSRNYFNNDYSVCYGYKNNLPKSLESNNIKYIPIETITIDKDKIDRNTDEFFTRVRKRIRKLEKNTNNTQNIETLFWLIDHRDFYFDIYNRFTVIEKLKKIIKEHKTCSIHIILKEYYRIIEGLIRSDIELNDYHITVSFVNKNSLISKIEETVIFQYIFNFILTISLLFYILFRKIVAKIFVTNDHGIDEKVLSMTSPDSWDLKKGIDRNQHTIHNVLIDNNLPFIYLDYITHNGLYLRNFISKLMTEYYLPLEYFFPVRNLFKYFYSSKNIFNNFRVIRKIIEAPFNHISGQRYLPELKTRFILDAASPFLSSYKICIEELLKKQKVKFVIFQPDAGLFGRWFGPMFTSKEIPFIGIQHGMIRENNVAYRHMKSHINPEDYTNSERNPNYCPLPTCTLVWSDYVKELLSGKYHYPAESVYVVGNSQLNAFKMTNAADVKKIKENLNIPVNKKIILLTVRTGGMGHTIEYDLAVLENVYKISQTGSKYFVLCKLHGLETKRIHTEVYEKLKLTGSQAVITRNIDITTAIRISDVVISVRSTTIYEAMALGKPVIIINPGDMDMDAVDIGNSGGVYYATDYDELTDQLDKIFNNNITDTMKEIQAKLVKEKLGDIDIDSGKLIETFIQNELPV